MERQQGSEAPGVRRDPIVIVEYDEQWPALFERERTKLEGALESVLVRPIEHIGSTAVPGLAAKPIIDMCAVVEDIAALDQRSGALSDIGWIAAPEPNDEADRRRSYCTPSVELRTHHLHVVEHRSPGWPRWLAFRDRLRSQPAAALEYAELKRSLAARSLDPNDREGYRSGKAGLIQRITAEAIEERQDRRGI